MELILEKLLIELLCQELEGFSCSCVLVVNDFSSRQRGHVHVPWKKVEGVTAGSQSDVVSKEMVHL